MSAKHKPKATMLIISGPSGAGKTVIAEALLKKFRQLEFVRGTSTRPQTKRKGGDTALFFVSPAEFRAIRKRDGFLETARVRKHLFGTSRAAVAKIIRNKHVPMLVVDVKGHADIRRMGDYRVCSVFITAENIATLKKRILLRQPDIAPDQLALRLAEAHKELRRKNEYDVVLVNRQGKLSEALRKVSAWVDKCLGAR
jgi:guanylate kinase